MILNIEETLSQKERNSITFRVINNHNAIKTTFCNTNSKNKYISTTIIGCNYGGQTLAVLLLLLDQS